MTWQVKSIPIEGLRTVWPIVAPLLAPAVAGSGGRVTMRNVFEGLEASRYLLWVAHQEDNVVAAALLTRVTAYPNRRMLTIDAAGGTELSGWAEEADRTFRAFARQSGLDGVEAHGRAGWARALRRLGWQQVSVTVEAF